MDEGLYVLVVVVLGGGCLFGLRGLLDGFLVGVVIVEVSFGDD